MGIASSLVHEFAQSEMKLVVAPAGESARPRRYAAPGRSQSGPFPVFDGEASVRLVTDAELDYTRVLPS